MYILFLMFEIFNLYENILKINYASSFFFLPLKKKQLNFALFYTALTCSPLEQFALKVEGCSQTTWKVVFYQNKQPAPSGVQCAPTQGSNANLKKQQQHALSISQQARDSY